MVQISNEVGKGTLGNVEEMIGQNTPQLLWRVLTNRFPHIA